MPIQKVKHTHELVERIKRLAALSGLNITKEDMETLTAQIKPILLARKRLDELILNDFPPDSSFVVNNE